ncbi:hypothetical protein Bca52824_047796 [Brassica carinata]|uniref:DUF4283 domain-containing protein n=1 Tax=Brassica carinata TaxID=52824 RepID=A0A8X7RHX7_BRACI|nr:hypothetical protein Bca52824_047796 [Brassica carinata]
MASPTFADDGTPVVMAPESVILKSSDIWKGYLVAQFHGTTPSPAKIFADLNPIWESKEGSELGTTQRIKWVLDVGLWHSGKCAFPVFEWSPKINLAPMRLEYAPIGTFATGVGIPVQSEFPKLPPYSNGVVKLKVIIKLAGKRASTVKVVDKLGNSVFISAEYLKVPHKCGICFRNLGTLSFAVQIANFKTLPLPQIMLSPTCFCCFSSGSAASPADNLNTAAQFSTSARAAVVPIVPSVSKAFSKDAPTLTARSTSLPNSKFGASSPRSASGSLTWIPVVHRTPPARVRTNTSPVRPEAYCCCRAELPPLSTAKDRRRVRQHQRQAMQKICNNLDVSSSTSDIPTVFQREASPNGKSPPILEA